MTRKIFIVAVFLFFVSFSSFSQESKPKSDHAAARQLMLKTWEALESGQFKDVHTFADLCIQHYGDEAEKMQSALKDFPVKDQISSYGTLNNVATCLFLKGRAYYIRGDNDKAKKIFRVISEKYTFAQCMDKMGDYWKVADAAKDQIILMETGLNFGDYTSQTLTVKAWNALNRGEYDRCLLYTRKCIQLYKDFAKDMQNKLEDYPENEKAFDYWALNDVGTCYFIASEVYMAKKEFQKARQALQVLITDYHFTQCWDSHGQFFWKPAKQAQVSLIIMQGVRAK